MIRTRLLWFTLGFSVTSAAIGQFIWKDLLAHRLALSSQSKQTFDGLEARVLNLESTLQHSSNPAQIEG